MFAQKLSQSRKNAQNERKNIRPLVGGVLQNSMESSEHRQFSFALCRKITEILCLERTDAILAKFPRGRFRQSLPLSFKHSQCQRVVFWSWHLSNDNNPTTNLESAVAS